MPRLLFAIVGVGSGNSTRNLAILRELAADRDLEIKIAAQGRAYEFFKDRFPTFPLEEVTYTKDARFTPWSLLKSNLSFPRKFLRNVAAYGRILDEYRPDLIVADSDFYCLRPARRRRIPILTLNSSAVVVETFRRLRPRPRGHFFSYRLIESTDYWIQRRFATEVICPVVQLMGGLSRKFHQVPPIVRQEFLRDDDAPPQTQRRALTVMLGGSGIGAETLDLRFWKEPCAALGRLPLGPRQLEVLGFTDRPDILLRQSDRVIIQGGFSSISELIALRKPCIVVPIPGHAEQFINAHTLERLGVAIRSRGTDLPRALNLLEKRYDSMRRRYDELNLACDGHLAAAQIIREFARAT
ncbi:MAG: glycosyltransferase family protein [bacterium]